MKTIKPLFITLLLFTSFLFISCEEDSDADELDESESIISGLYKKQVSQTAAYLKITSSQGFLCRAQDNIEFSGNIVGNTVHFEVDGSIIETELRQDGDNLWARNLRNNNWDEWTEYFPTNDNYPCNGNNNDYTNLTNGDVVFWRKEINYDPNYPFAIVLRTPNQPDRVSNITGGYTPNYYNPPCTQTYHGGNFYNLPVGTYLVLNDRLDGNPPVSSGGYYVVQQNSTNNPNFETCRSIEI